jgi:hypothetical protein
MDLDFFCKQAARARQSAGSQVLSAEAFRRLGLHCAWRGECKSQDPGTSKSVTDWARSCEADFVAPAAANCAARKHRLALGAGHEVSGRPLTGSQSGHT